MIMSVDEKRRVKAAIIYTMEELCNTLGHCYLNIEEIYKYTIMFLGNNISEEDFIEILNELILEIKIVKEEDHYLLMSMWDAEENITRRIKYLSLKEDFKVNDMISI